MIQHVELSSAIDGAPRVHVIRVDAENVKSATQAWSPFVLLGWFPESGNVSVSLGGLAKYGKERQFFGRWKMKDLMDPIYGTYDGVKMHFSDDANRALGLSGRMVVDQMMEAAQAKNRTRS